MRLFTSKKWQCVLHFKTLKSTNRTQGHAQFILDDRGHHLTPLVSTCVLHQTQVINSQNTLSHSYLNYVLIVNLPGKKPS